MSHTLTLERPLTGSQRALLAAAALQKYRANPETIPPDIQRPAVRGKVEWLMDAVSKRFDVSHSTVGEALHILKHGLPEELMAIRAGKASVPTTYARVRQRLRRSADVIPFNRTNRHNGPYVRVPAGMTLGQLARQAANLRQSMASVAAVAAQLGISTLTCSQIIDIVLVAGRNDLTGTDAEIAAATLRRLDSGDTSIRDMHAAIQPICDRLWGTRRGGGAIRTEAEALRRSRFESAMGVLIQACANGDRMEVPHLSPKAAGQVAADLREAIRSVRALMQRVEDIHS